MRLGSRGRRSRAGPRDVTRPTLPGRETCAWRPRRCSHCCEACTPRHCLVAIRGGAASSCACSPMLIYGKNCYNAFCSLSHPLSRRCLCFCVCACLSLAHAPASLYPCLFSSVSCCALCTTTVYPQDFFLGTELHFPTNCYLMGRHARPLPRVAANDGRTATNIVGLLARSSTTGTVLYWQTLAHGRSTVCGCSVRTTPVAISPRNWKWHPQTAPDCRPRTPVYVPYSRTTSTLIMGTMEVKYRAGPRLLFVM